MCQRILRWGVAIVLLGAGLAHSATTSRLEGTVLDDQGGPLAGVEVTISSDSLIGGPRSVISGSEGEFAFNLLLVGDYTVEAALVGYEPAIAVVPVRLDRTASVTLRLVPVSFTGEIEVGAEVPIIDATRTSTGEVFSIEYLQRATIGSDGRSFAALLDQAAGVVPDGVRGEVFGATGSENAHIVDGFIVTDPSTGGSATHFAFDALEEASVLTGGIGAEFGFGTGGVVNVVTKSGGNHFSGTFDARYRDESFNESGDHYDPDVDVSSRRILSATLGGPILRDRLWFFAAAENEHEKITPVGAPRTRVDDRYYLLGKLTWSIDANNRLALRYSATPGSHDYSGVASWTAPEATRYVETSEPTAQLELSSVLSDSVLLTVGLGAVREFLDAVPMLSDLDTPSEYDMDSDLLFSSPGWVEYSDRDRDHHHAKLTWFMADAIGPHQLDLGLEYHRLQTFETGFTPGGYLIEYFNNEYQDEPWPDSDGDGLVDYDLWRDYPAETARDPFKSESDGWSAFVQDEWRPLPQLTVRAGLRYDTMKHTNTVGEKVADFEKWLPRLGVAWDLGGRSRHVVRAGWSRYMHPGVTNLSWQVSGTIRGYEYYLGLDYLCATEGLCDRDAALAEYGTEFVHVDRDGDEHFFYLVGIDSQIPAETVDTLGVGRLRVPYRDEWVLSWEARLAEETSLELTYVRKDYHDLIEDTCNSNSWLWGDGSPPRLDEPSTWPDEDACTGSVRVNADALERRYEAVILRAASRARPWFHVVASYTYSRTRGSSPFSNPFTGFGSGFWAFPRSVLDRFPTGFVNLDGNLAPDYRHSLKLNGYLQLPLDLTVAVAAWYRSAEALSVIANCDDMLYPSDSGLAELERLDIDYEQMLPYCQSRSSGNLILEPPGSRRGADLWQLNLQLTKGFEVGRTRLMGIVSVFNVFSEEAPTSFIEDPFNRRGWGAATDWQAPRRWEVGFRVEF